MRPVARRCVLQADSKTIHRPFGFVNALDAGGPTVIVMPTKPQAARLGCSGRPMPVYTCTTTQSTLSSDVKAALAVEAGSVMPEPGQEPACVSQSYPVGSLSPLCARTIHNGPDCCGDQRPVRPRTAR